MKWNTENRKVETLLMIFLLKIKRTTKNYISNN